MTSVSASFESTLTTDKSQGLLVLLFPNSGGVVIGWLTTQLQILGLFLERPVEKRPRKSFVVYVQYRGFNSFVDNMIKSSVDKTKWTGFLARPQALILYILIWIFGFGHGNFDKRPPEALYPNSFKFVPWLLEVCYKRHPNEPVNALSFREIFRENFEKF